MNQLQPTIYCLQVVIARPSYKRPSAHVIVEHFTTEESAQARLREIKSEYIEDYAILKDDESVDAEEEEMASISEFDAMLADGRIHDRVFGDSYMDMPPFDAKIFQVNCRDPYLKN